MQPQGSGRWHQLPTDHDAGAWKRRREWWKEMNHEERDSTRRAFFFFFLFNCIHSQNTCTRLCTLFLFFQRGSKQQAVQCFIALVLRDLTSTVDRHVLVNII